MWNKKIVTQTIEQNIQKLNLEKADEACYLAINKGELSKADKQFLKKSLLKLSEFHNKKSNLINAIVDIEYARALLPGDSKVLQKEMELFKKFIKRYEEKFVSLDLTYLEIIINEITSDYITLPQRNIYGTGLEYGFQIIEQLGSMKNKTSANIESKLTYKISRIFEIVANAKYQNFSEEERREKVSKYLGNALKKISIKKKHIIPKKE